MITNTGPSAGQGVVFTDSLPDGTTFVSATTTQGTCKAGKNKTITCNLGTMKAGASVTITLVLKRTNFTIHIVNTATASSATFDPDTSNNSATATVARR